MKVYRQLKDEEKTNMKKIIKTEKPFFVFLMEADKDYLLARLINLSGAAFSSRAGFFSQQACEKYFKALTVQEKGEYLKTHNLKELALHCSNFDDDFKDKEMLSDLEIFDSFREVGRYGGESDFDPFAVTTDEIQTSGVVTWSGSYIEKLDKFVFKIRGKLDFVKMNFSDSLKAIIDNKKDDLLVDTWSLPIPLDQILLNKNKHFQNEKIN